MIRLDRQWLPGLEKALEELECPLGAPEILSDLILLFVTVTLSDLEPFDEVEEPCGRDVVYSPFERFSVRLANREVLQRHKASGFSF